MMLAWTAADATPRSAATDCYSCVCSCKDREQTLVSPRAGVLTDCTGYADGQCRFGLQQLIAGPGIQSHAQSSLPSEPVSVFTDPTCLQQIRAGHLVVRHIISLAISRPKGHEAKDTVTCIEQVQGLCMPRNRHIACCTSASVQAEGTRVAGLPCCFLTNGLACQQEQRPPALQIVQMVPSKAATVCAQSQNLHLNQSGSCQRR